MLLKFVADDAGSLRRRNACNFCKDCWDGTSWQENYAADIDGNQSCSMEMNSESINKPMWPVTLNQCITLNQCTDMTLYLMYFVTEILRKKS